MNLSEAFTRHEDDFLEVGKLTSRPHKLKDVCAIMLIDEAIGIESDRMVSAAEHDVIYLDVDCERLAEVADDDLIANLVRCGVMYDAETDRLSMFP